MSFGQAPILLDDSPPREEGPDGQRRKTKIVATIGPACSEVGTILDMIDAGMNVARLNYAHGDQSSHERMLTNVREAAKQRPDQHVAIMLELTGPIIRTGLFREDVGDSVTLTAGQELKLVTDYSFRGDSACIAISFPKLPEVVSVGGTILLADGSLALTVKSTGDGHVVTEVVNGVTLGQRKNCHLAGVKVEMPAFLGPDETAAVLEFAIPQGVDFIAASFVQCKADVQALKKVLGLRGRAIKIVSKIGNAQGLRNLEEIVEASDVLMVARGDLGMEVPPEKLFLAQKRIIAKCNAQGKPVITATQMLESMCSSPRPTRAEATDVANAVLDGTDCVMLAGETAVGKFPVEAVRTMQQICEEADRVLDYHFLYLTARLTVLSACGVMSPVECTCSSAVKTSLVADCRLLLAVTETGGTARMLAKYWPRAMILAITASESTARALLCVRGVWPMLAASFVGTDSVIQKALARAKAEGIAKRGDRVVAVHGQREECPGHSNLMKLIIVT